MNRDRPLGPLLVLAGLVVAGCIGQAELMLRGHHASANHVLGVALASVVTVAVAALGCFLWYLRHGRWLPFRYREAPELTATILADVVAHAVSQDFREDYPGVYSGPPPAPIGDDEA